MPRTAVIIATSASSLSGAPTGTWLEEVAAPYYLFQGDGLDVVIASPVGGEVPVDEKSRGEGFYTAAAKRFDADPEATKKLKESIPVADLVDVLSGEKEEKEGDSGVAVVFVAGGHGIVADYDDPNLTKALEAAVANGRTVVAAVCHGVAALLPVKLPDGKPLLEGKPATCFSNEEEEAVSMTSKMPENLKSLEDAVKKVCGGGDRYSKAGEPWGVCVVAEGKLVTGQNPASSTGTALAALAALGAGEAGGSDKEEGGACC